jgi:hypothetical protein
MRIADAPLWRSGPERTIFFGKRLPLLPSQSMNPTSMDYAATYAGLAEPDLMYLAHSYDTLTGKAQTALRGEFARRGLEPPLIEEAESSDSPDQRNLVTVSRYRDLSEAILVRSILESAGILVYLRDENLVRLDWQVSNFIGGIPLQVEAADEQQAVELLGQPIQETIPYKEDDEFLQPHCPSCGSSDITFEGASRGAALTTLYVLSLPLPTGRATWLCAVCGARWAETDS